MRKLLFIAVLATAAAFSAGAAWARIAPPPGPPAPERAPLRVPSTLPSEDAAHPGAWGYATSESIARTITGGDAGGSAAANKTSGATSSTVTVTATVLPVVTIVAGEAGIEEIWINTPDRDPSGVLFTVRTELDGGEVLPLDAATWAATRAALADATAGTGRIWTASA